MDGDPRSSIYVQLQPNIRLEYRRLIAGDSNAPDLAFTHFFYS